MLLRTNFTQFVNRLLFLCFRCLVRKVCHLAQALGRPLSLSLRYSRVVTDLIRHEVPLLVMQGFESGHNTDNQVFCPLFSLLIWLLNIFIAYYYSNIQCLTLCRCPGYRPQIWAMSFRVPVAPLEASSLTRIAPNGDVFTLLTNETQLWFVFALINSIN